MSKRSPRTRAQLNRNKTLFLGPAEIVLALQETMGHRRIERAPLRCDLWVDARWTSGIQMVKVESTLLAHF